MLVWFSVVFNKETWLQPFVWFFVNNESNFWPLSFYRTSLSKYKYLGVLVTGCGMYNYF